MARRNIHIHIILNVSPTPSTYVTVSTCTVTHRW